MTVTLKDDGGTAGGGGDTITQTFTITVQAVNDAPSFVKGADQLSMTGSVLASPSPAGGTSISAGPTNEASQSLTFASTTNNDVLFRVLPAVDSATGTLSYTPAAGKWGSATVTVRLKDDGGTVNGGIDTSAPQTFMITIKPYQILLPLVRRN